MSYANGIGNPQEAISSISSPLTTPTVLGAASSGKADKAVVSSSNVQHADQATVSSTASLVARALDGSDARSEKVASLRQAIAAGNYNVPSDAVADKIIQTMSE
jgi:negative regulator of flagellin synthesis FlgM